MQASHAHCVLCKLERCANKLGTASFFVFLKIYLKLYRNKHIWQFKALVAQCVELRAESPSISVLMTEDFDLQSQFTSCRTFYTATATQSHVNKCSWPGFSSAYISDSAVKGLDSRDTESRLHSESNTAPAAVSSIAPTSSPLAAPLSSSSSSSSSTFSRATSFS